MSDAAPTTPTDDPGYLAAVTDLLGVLAYGELRAFSQLARDAEQAPTLRQSAALARLAAHELRNYEVLADRLGTLGVTPEDAMEPFVPAVDFFHERTKPSDWLEGVVKAYVGDGIAQDFYREIAQYVDPDTQALVLGVLEDTGQADFAVTVVREAIAADPRVGGRLALWGRRLVGEAITQAQRVGVERDSLAGILVGAPGRPGADLAELGRMFARLTDEHTRRMERLGLSA
ncbi:ferritin-like fold-containing protein [Intrasporangium sp. YIM S08009]|uniref:ferritin-like fold-containing protein n=1 Tax=Intrasporangium zincisolvens TaxID=3080018 RepID=UPI002B05A89D|nr:ferritin-like fold-containing protein [Intrasporangium sp. YIM S08009]